MSLATNLDVDSSDSIVLVPLCIWILPKPTSSSMLLVYEYFPTNVVFYVYLFDYVLAPTGMYIPSFVDANR